MHGPLPRLVGLLFLATALSLAAASCSGDGGPQCGDSNCNGCCSEAGECIGFGEQKRNQCGLGGAACNACPATRDCKNGRCLILDEDAGEEDAGGEVDSGFTPCGSSGEQCCLTSPQCFFGLECELGFCVTPDPPDSGNVICGGQNESCCVTAPECGLGLECQGSVCVVAPTCGNDGEACCATNPECQGALTCQQNVCRAPITASKGVGESCVQDNECDAGACEQSLGFTDGYCSKSCVSSAAGQCPAGSTCGVKRSGGNNLCLDSCTAGQAGTTNGCRQGYVCDKANTSMNRTPVCYPACSSQLECGTNDCDSRGFCCGGGGAACCEGSTCNGGFACDGGYCQTAGATLRSTGSSCTDAGQCAGAACFTQQTNPGTGTTLWPGGYCTETNCQVNGCLSGSACSVVKSTPGGSTSDTVCLDLCTFDGGQGNCRSGYVCDRGWIRGNVTTTSCIFACEVQADCGGAVQCDARGVCCGAPGFSCCNGTTCNTGSCGSNGLCP